MINNLAKVIIAENGSIKDFEDTAFLVSNADEVNSIQCMFQIVLVLV